MSSMFSAPSSRLSFNGINPFGSGAFGATSSASVHSPAAFGSPTSFGGTSAFGSGKSATSDQTQNMFVGSSSLPTFGKKCEGNLFGSPAFGVASNSMFGLPSTTTFGSYTFGQPAGSLSGREGTQPMLKSSGFGKSVSDMTQKGSRVASYTPTPEKESPNFKFQSICFMNAYKDKSPEELRSEDYQLGDKGQTSGSIFGQTSVFGVVYNSRAFKPPLFNQSTDNSSTATSTPFPKSPTSSNIFSPKTSFIGCPCTGRRGASALTTSGVSFSPGIQAQPFGPLKPASTSSTTSFFSPSTNPWAVSTSSSSTLTQSLPSTSQFSSSPSVHTGLAKPSGYGFDQKTISSPIGFPIFPAVSPSPLSSNFLENSPSLPSIGPGNTTSSSGVSFSPGIHTQPFGPPKPASSPSTTSILSPSNNPWALPAVSPSSCLPTPGPSWSNGLENSQQSLQLVKPTSPSLPSVGLGNATTPSLLPTLGSTQNTALSLGPMQPSPVMLPSETQPAVQVSIKHLGSETSVQYGISSLPVTDKSAPVRRRSSLIIRHSSLSSRNRLTPQKYNPTNDKPKVPFFMDPDIVREAVIIPRDNPRDWVSSITKQFPSSSDSSRLSDLKHTSMDGQEVGNNCGKPKLAPKEMHNNDTSGQYLQVSLDAGSISSRKHSNKDNVDAILPKLQRVDYYTVPSIQELTSKEKKEAGFCCRVKNFVVGRHGYGSIKFLEETDVRKLDLDSAVHFNCREVIVYMDDNKKPPVGQGLNKPAEITLLNVRCINKSTGKEYKDGPLVDKYKDMLIRKTAEQGAEFVSYDPVKGEWKFKISHF